MKKGNNSSLKTNSANRLISKSHFISSQSFLSYTQTHTYTFTNHKLQPQVEASNIEPCSIIEQSEGMSVNG